MQNLVNIIKPYISLPFGVPCQFDSFKANFFFFLKFENHCATALKKD